MGKKENEGAHKGESVFIADRRRNHKQASIVLNLTRRAIKGLDGDGEGVGVFGERRIDEAEKEIRANQ